METKAVFELNNNMIQAHTKVDERGVRYIEFPIKILMENEPSAKPFVVHRKPYMPKRTFSAYINVATIDKFRAKCSESRDSSAKIVEALMNAYADGDIRW